MFFYCRGQRKFSVKDAEKPQKEYYDPVICECIQWIKNHVLLREKRLDTAKFVCYKEGKVLEMTTFRCHSNILSHV